MTMINQVESSLSKYNTQINSAMVKNEIEKQKSASPHLVLSLHSLLSLTRQQENHYRNEIAQLHAALRATPPNHDTATHHHSRLVKWLLDFKPKFGNEESAKDAVRETEEALHLYSQVSKCTKV